MTDNKIEVEKFKDLIKEIYEGYPNWRYPQDKLHSVIISEEDREHLIKQKILTRSKPNGKYLYGLGPEGLSLVSNWKSEDFTENVNDLTKTLVKLTILAITIAIIALIGSAYFHYSTIVFSQNLHNETINFQRESELNEHISDMISLEMELNQIYNTVVSGFDGAGLNKLNYSNPPDILSNEELAVAFEEVDGLFFDDIFMGNIEKMLTSGKLRNQTIRFNLVIIQARTSYLRSVFSINFQGVYTSIDSLFLDDKRDLSIGELKFATIYGFVDDDTIRQTRGLIEQYIECLERERSVDACH